MRCVNFSDLRFTSKSLAMALMLLMLPLFSLAQTEDIVNTKTREGVTKRVEIAEEDLPAVMQGHYDAKYPMNIFIEAFKYLDEEGNVHYYEVRLERDNKKDVQLMYNSKGENMKKGEERKMKKMKEE